jgi:hypothetical protein
VEYLTWLPERGIVNTVRVAFQLADDGAIHGIMHNIPGFGLTVCALSVLFIIILVVSDGWTRVVPGTKCVMRAPLVLRWIGYYALILVIMSSWSTDTSQFIYFTF